MTRQSSAASSQLILSRAKYLLRQRGFQRNHLCLAFGVCNLLPVLLVLLLQHCAKLLITLPAVSGIQTFRHLASLSLSSTKLSLASDSVCTWPKGPMHDWLGLMKVVSPIQVAPAAVTAYCGCMPHQTPCPLVCEPHALQSGLHLGVGRNANDEHDSRRRHSKALCDLSQ